MQTPAGGFFMPRHRTQIDMCPNDVQRCMDCGHAYENMGDCSAKHRRVNCHGEHSAIRKDCPKRALPSRTKTDEPHRAKSEKKIDQHPARFGRNMAESPALTQLRRTSTTVSRGINLWTTITRTALANETQWTQRNEEQTIATYTQLLNFLKIKQPT